MVKKKPWYGICGMISPLYLLNILYRGKFLVSRGTCLKIHVYYIYICMYTNLYINIYNGLCIMWFDKIVHLL